MASDLKIKPTNYVANLRATTRNTQFHPMTNFLNNCPLTHALTAAPTMDKQRLLEYWSTSSTNTGFTHLSGKIDGKELVFTLTTLATVLQLPTDATEEYVDPPSKEQIWEMLESIGYKEKTPKLGTIVRSKMSPCWSFFFDAIIRCISGKTGSFHQAAGLTLHLAYGLIMGKKINYAKLIFDDICQKSGNDHLLYPRFLTLMIQTQIEVPTPVLELPVSRISDHIFQKKHVEEDEKPLTIGMLSLLVPQVHDLVDTTTDVTSPVSDTPLEQSSIVVAIEEPIADDENLLDSVAVSHNKVYESMLVERLSALEVAIKDQREDAIRDREYCMSRFDDFAVTLSQVVTSLGEIQQRLNYTCSNTDVQLMINGVHGDLSSVNDRLSRLIDENRTLAKFTVSNKDDIAKFQEVLMNKPDLDLLNAKRKEESEQMKKNQTGDTVIRVSLANRFIKRMKSWF